MSQNRKAAAAALTEALKKPKKKRSDFKDDSSEPVVLPPDGDPLDYMLAVMRDVKASKERRDRMAIAACPFVHKKINDFSDRPKPLKQQRAENAEKIGTEGNGGQWSGLLLAND